MPLAEPPQPRPWPRARESLESPGIPWNPMESSGSPGIPGSPHARARGREEQGDKQTWAGEGAQGKAPSMEDSLGMGLGLGMQMDPDPAPPPSPTPSTSLCVFNVSSSFNSRVYFPFLFVFYHFLNFSFAISQCYPLGREGGIFWGREIGSLLIKEGNEV